MSKTPETDLVTAGCHFGPFVEALAGKCRELEVQRNQMFEVLVGIIGTDDSAGLAEARIGVSVAKHLWIRKNVSPAAILDAIQMLSTVKAQRETAGKGQVQRSEMIVEADTLKRQVEIAINLAREYLRNADDGRTRTVLRALIYDLEKGGAG